MPEAVAALTERGARTRERILLAAREVFEEQGFLDTRITHITRRARVAYGSFYTYFPTKEAVFFELADRLFEDMTTHEPATAATPAERIRGVNRAYYEAYRRNARLMAIVEQVATFNEEFAGRRRAHRAWHVERSARAIRRWQRDGAVDATLDPRMAARALAAMVDHSLYLWLVHDGGPDAGTLLDTLDALTARALGLPG
ncbi:TetR/AcrR family transcriptional regulator [Amycolatopsis sp. K13G38]|uniref:TetR/AcrR family transcriptional regulator n=1 Tax=Amycolatopsis acididurans TaxID=2724524 RepID=A0ABX1JHN5_9PSEU|nr:TetR/AcrR family transcriptional regulator [Amycolatopsis acididurans]NKQ58879.1 TetR/AcrR family transcriptional regulator [Amycolatopsis acididurans]